MELANLTPVDHPLSVFRIKDTKTRLRGYAERCAHTPIVDQNYIPQWDVLEFLIFWWMRKDNKPLWLWGHTGTGKSSAFEQFFALLNIPVFTKAVNGYTKFEEFEGYMGINDEGKTEFQYGALPLAMMHGGILMIDEADKLDPVVASGFHGVLDGKPLVLLENGGEPIYPHPNFRIVCTANTNGSGDSNGLYPASQVQDTAYMARFIAMKVGYMSPQQEQMVLQRAIGNDIDANTLGRMVEFSTKVRELFTSDTMEAKNKTRITMEVRSIIDWAKMTVQVQGVAKQNKVPVEYALEAVLLSKASAGDRAKLEGLYQRVFGKTFGKSLEETEQEEE